MGKDKCVICTIGTSIANGCSLQKEYFKPNHPWEEDIVEFEKEISSRVAGLGSDVHKISAELNSLAHLDLTKNSKVILLATDNAASKACANELKKAVATYLGLAEKNIEIKRIKGLQVHNIDELKKQGFRELITVVLTYLRDENLNYQYELVLNPTGGYKGVIPFLIVLGMLYGKRSVYIFEHAEQLISLPPLPFTFDIDIYERAKPALKLIDEKVAINEQAYYGNIIDYIEQEKPLFTSFIEPIDGNLVTISPLAEVLLSIENRDAIPSVSQNIIDDLQNDITQPALVLKRLIKNSVNPLWRQQHSEKWHETDLIVIKQNATAERLAGFIKDDTFHVAYAFRTHELYERDLPKYSEKTAKELDYKLWNITDNVGQASSGHSSSLERERDELLIQKQQLEMDIEVADFANLEKEEKIEGLQQDILNLNQYIEVLQQKNIELNQQQENTQALLPQHQVESQQVFPKKLWAKLIYLFKGD